MGITVNVGPVIKPVDELIRALRSGKYRQTKFTLRRGRFFKSFCIEGLLCEVYRKLIGGYWVQCGDYYEFHSRGEVADMRAPEHVRRYFGIDPSTNLGIANDHYGWTFADVANWLEAKKVNGGSSIK